MINWFTQKYIIKVTHYNEQQIREIIARDLPTHHLKRKPTKKGGQDATNNIGS